MAAALKSISGTQWVFLFFQERTKGHKNKYKRKNPHTDEATSGVYFNDNSKDLQKSELSNCSPYLWIYLTALIVQQYLGQYKGKKKLRPNQLYITQCPNQERDSNPPKVLNKDVSIRPVLEPETWGQFTFASLFKTPTSSVSQINMNQMPGSPRSAKAEALF